MSKLQDERDAILDELLALWESGGARMIKLPNGVTLKRRQHEADLINKLRPIAYAVGMERKNPQPSLKAAGGSSTPQLEGGQDEAATAPKDSPKRQPTLLPDES